MTEAARHTSLVGWWFVEGAKDHSSFRLGQIVGEVIGGLYYIITFSLTPDANTDYPPPHEVISIADLNEKCAHCGERLWDLFKTRDDRNAYVAANSQLPGAEPPPSAAPSAKPDPKKMLN